MRGGKRPGAGRKPGSGNKMTRRLSAKALAKVRDFAVMPLDVMHSVMLKSYQEGDFGMALEASKALAPYVHPRLSPTDKPVQPHRAQKFQDDLFDNVPLSPAKPAEPAAEDEWQRLLN